MKRTWDETKSPQWRYLLSRESELRRGRKLFKSVSSEEEDENIDTSSSRGGDFKRNKPGKKAKKKQQQQQHNTSKEKRFTKLGKEIVYSASPGHIEHFHPKKEND